MEEPTTVTTAATTATTTTSTANLSTNANQNLGNQVATANQAATTATDLRVGERVRIGHTGQLGTLRYWGTTEFRDGLWAGVELDDDSGKNDGSVQGWVLVVEVEVEVEVAGGGAAYAHLIIFDHPPHHHRIPGTIHLHRNYLPPYPLPPPSYSPYRPADSVSYFQCAPSRGLFILAHRISRHHPSGAADSSSGTYEVASAGGASAGASASGTTSSHSINRQSKAKADMPRQLPAAASSSRPGSGSSHSVAAAANKKGGAAALPPAAATLHSTTTINTTPAQPSDASRDALDSRGSTPNPDAAVGRKKSASTTTAPVAVAVPAPAPVAEAPTKRPATTATTTADKAKSDPRRATSASTTTTASTATATTTAATTTILPDDGSSSRNTLSRAGTAETNAATGTALSNLVGLSSVASSKMVRPGSSSSGLRGAVAATAAPMSSSSRSLRDISLEMEIQQQHQQQHQHSTAEPAPHASTSTSSILSATTVGAAPIVDVRIIEGIKKSAPSGSIFAKTAAITATPNGKAVEMAKRASMLLDRQADIAMALEQLKRSDNNSNATTGSSAYANNNNNKNESSASLTLSLSEDRHASGTDFVSAFTNADYTPSAAAVATSSSFAMPSSSMMRMTTTTSHSRKSSINSGSAAIARIRSSISAASSSAPMSRHIFSAPVSTLQEDDEMNGAGYRVASELKAADNTVLHLQLADSQQQVARMQDDLIHLQTQYRSETSSLREQNTVLGEEIARLKGCVRDAEVIVQEGEVELDRWMRECERAKKLKLDQETEHRLRLEEIEKSVAQVELEHEEELEREREAMDQERARLQTEYDRKLERERERLEKLDSEKDRWRKELDAARDNWLQKEADLEQRSANLDKKLLDAFSNVEILRKEKDSWKKEKALIAEKLREHQQEVDRVIKGEELKLKRAVDTHLVDKESWEATKTELETRLVDEQTAKRSLDEKVQALESSLVQASEQHAIQWDTERQDLLSKITELASDLRSAENARDSTATARDQEVERLLEEVTASYQRSTSLEAEKQSLQAQLDDALKSQADGEKQLDSLTIDAKQMALEIQGLVARIKELDQMNRSLQQLAETGKVSGQELKVLQSERDDLLARLQQSDQDKKHISEQVQQLQKLETSLKQSEEEREQESKTWSIERQDLLDCLQDTKASLQVAKEQEAELLAEKTRLLEEAHVLQSEFDYTVQQLDEAESQKKALTVQLSDAVKLQSDAAQSETLLKESQAEVTVLKASLEQASQREAQANAHIASLSETAGSEHSQLAAQLAAAEASVAALESAKARWVEQASAQEASLKTLEEIPALKETIRLLEEQSKSADATTRQLQSALEEARSQEGRLSKQITAQATADGKRAEDLETANRTIADLQEMVSTLQSDVDNATTQLYGLRELPVLQEQIRLLQEQHKQAQEDRQKLVVELEAAVSKEMEAAAQLQFTMLESQTEKNTIYARVEAAEQKVVTIEGLKADLERALETQRSESEKEQDQLISHLQTLSQKFESLEKEQASLETDLQGKLQSSESDKKTLKDRIQETEQQLSALEKEKVALQSDLEVLRQASAEQASKDVQQLAEQRSELESRLEDLQERAAHANARSSELQTSLEETKTLLLERDAQIVQLQSETVAQQKEVVSFRAQVSELTNLLEIQKQLIADKEVSAQQVQGQLAAIATERDQTKSALEQLQSQEKNLSEQLAQEKLDLTEKLQALSSQLDAKEHEMFDVKQDLERQLHETNSILNATMTALENERFDKATLEADKNLLSDEKVQLELAAETLGNSVEQYGAQLQSLHEQLATMTAEQETTKEKMVQQADLLNAVQEEKASLDRILREYTIAIEARDKSSIDMEGQILELHGQLQQATAVWNEANTALEAQRSKNAELEQSLAHVTQEREALEGKLESTLETIAIEKKDAEIKEEVEAQLHAQLAETTAQWQEAKSNLELLQTKDTERATRLASLSDDKAFLEQQLADLKLASETSQQQASSTYETTITGLKDQLTAAQIALQGNTSALEQERAIMLQVQQRLQDALQQAHAQNGDQVKSLEENSTHQIRQIQERYDALQAEFKISETVLQDLQTSEATLQEDKNRLVEQVKNWQDQYAKMEEVKTSVESRCNTLLNDLIGRDKQTEETQALWEKTKSTLETRVQELEVQLQVQTQELSLIHGDVNKKLNSIREEKERMDLNKRSDKQEIQVLRSQIELGHSQIQAVQEANLQIQSNLQQSEEKLRGMVVSYQQLQKDFKLLSSEKEKLVDKLQATNTFTTGGVQQIKKELDRVTQEKNDLEEMLKSVQDTTTQATTIYQEQVTALQAEQTKAAEEVKQLKATLSQLNNDLEVERSQLQAILEEKVALEETSEQRIAESREKARLEAEARLSELQRELKELTEQNAPAVHLQFELGQISQQMREEYEQIIVDLKKKHQAELELFHETVGHDNPGLLQDEIEMLRSESKLNTDRLTSQLQTKYQATMEQMEANLREQFAGTQSQLTLELQNQKDDYSRSLAVIKENQEAQLASLQKSLHEQYASDLTKMKEWYESQLAAVRQQIGDSNKNSTTTDVVIPEDVNVLRELLRKADEEKYRLTKELDLRNVQLKHLVDEHPHSEQQLQLHENREALVRSYEQQYAEAATQEEAKWRAELDKVRQTHLMAVEDILKHSEETRISFEQALVQKEKEVSDHLKHFEMQIAKREERIQALNDGMKQYVADAQEAQKTLATRITDLEYAIRQQKVAYAISTATANQLGTENEELIQRYDVALKDRNEFARLLEETRWKYGETVDPPKSPNFVMEGVRRISRLMSFDATSQERKIPLAPNGTPSAAPVVPEEEESRQPAAISADQPRAEAELCSNCNLRGEHTSDQCPDLVEPWCENCEVKGHATKDCERSEDVC